MSALATDTKTVIEKAIERIKLDTGLSYPDNGLLEIASALKVEVVEAELPDFQGKTVKGYIKWLPQDARAGEGNPLKAKISLNSNQFETTKTFTLAHELGHFLLHKETSNFRIDLEDYSATSDPKNQETEANYFAGCLLMPKDKFLSALNEAKSLSDVAKLFGVSVPAVEARMKWLHVVIA